MLARKARKGHRVHLAFPSSWMRTMTWMATPTGLKFWREARPMMRHPNPSMTMGMAFQMPCVDKKVAPASMGPPGQRVHQAQRAMQALPALRGQEAPQAR